MDFRFIEKRLCDMLPGGQIMDHIFRHLRDRIVNDGEFFGGQSIDLVDFAWNRNDREIFRQPQTGSERTFHGQQKFIRMDQQAIDFSPLGKIFDSSGNIQRRRIGLCDARRGKKTFLLSGAFCECFVFLRDRIGWHVNIRHKNRNFPAAF